MTVSKKYFWREISSDGLVKSPRDVGAYYNPDNVNKSSGFDSELEAMDALEKFNKNYPYEAGDLTLITIYRVE